MPYRHLAVLDAAEKAADLINELIDRPRRRPLLHATQLRKAAQSVRANIAEGFGRGSARACASSLRIAHGESDEVIQHLKANLEARLIDPAEYWPHHNRYVVIGKMVNSLRNRPSGRRRPRK